MSNDPIFDVFDNQWLCQDWFLPDSMPPAFSHDPSAHLDDYGNSTRLADPHLDRPAQSGLSEVHMSNWEEPQEVSSIQTSMPGGAFPWTASNNFVAPSMQNSEIHPEASPPLTDPVPRKGRRSARSSISNSVASSTSAGRDRPEPATATRREMRQYNKPRKVKSSGRRVSVPKTGSATATSAYSLPYHGQGNNNNISTSNSALGVQQISGSVLQHSGHRTRTPHALVEKRYREGMKAMFQRLRAVLPSSGGSTTRASADNESAVHTLPLESSPSILSFQQEYQHGDSEPPPPPPSQLTKASVIARAIEYIQQVEREKAYMQECCEGVLKENSKLSREVRLAEAAAAAAGNSGAGCSYFVGAG
ncbi:hypothetical protein MPH_13537 [Macrophomina phaseolina MS6]|uniref:BHLH domain-containing protein n=1 Tax=Macrophomina phaseolina (strain MS6) TaxID=1126212 RepID=K2RH68_MACPH|nr:hypothetical protein MPH_13537 [Macrophomina phaseolina MS6]